MDDMNVRSIGIIGVGKLGSDVAFMLAERDAGQVLLYDRDRERASYLASDLSGTSFGRGYASGVSSVGTMEELRGCDVILVSAGAQRPADYDQAELFARNRPLIHEIAQTFIGSSTLFVVASEPMDLLTAELTRLLQVPFSRVMGLRGVLDSYRVRHMLGEAMGFNPDYIRAQVIGSRDRFLVALWDYTSMNGIPIRSLVDEDILNRIEGTLATEDPTSLLRSSSSRYTPAMACLNLLEAIVRDERRILSVSVLWEDVVCISGVAMSIPCVVGSLGAERKIVPNLDADQIGALRDAGKAYTDILKGAQQ